MRAVFIPTSFNLITSTGTGDSVFTRPFPLLPTKMTSCKSVVLAVKITFKLPPVNLSTLLSNPTELNSISSFKVALILKLPFFAEVEMDLLVTAFTVTPSSAFPLLSVTVPFAVCFCAKVVMDNKVNTKLKGRINFLNIWG